MSRVSRRATAAIFAAWLCVTPICAQPGRDDTWARAKALVEEALRLQGQGQPEAARAAIRKWNEALSLCRELGDVTSEMNILAAIGSVHQKLGDDREAIASFVRALPIIRAHGTRLDEAEVLFAIGSSYAALKDARQAADYFMRARPIYAALGKSEDEALTLDNVGILYVRGGEPRKALGYYEQELEVARRAGDPVVESRALNNIGGVYDLLGDPRKAHDFFSQALPLARASGDRSGEAAILNNLAIQSVRAGQFEKGFEYHASELALRRSVGDRAGEATTLYNIGIAHSTFGDLGRALEHFAPALEIYRALGDREGEASTLNYFGFVHHTAGETQKALDYYTQALSLSVAVGDRNQQGVTLGNIGSLYMELGEHQRSIEYITEALAIVRALGDRRAEYLALNNLASSYRGLGETRKALGYAEQSLSLARAAGDEAAEGTALNSVGVCYLDLGEPRKALEYFTRSLPLSRTREASALNNIALVHESTGDLAQALDYYGRSLKLLRAAGPRQNEAATLKNIARIELRRGRLEEARAHSAAAVEILESLRTKIDNRQLRTAFFATVQDTYALYIDILMESHKRQPAAGHDAAALQVSERRRARSLLDTLVEAGADIRQGVEPALLERERALQRQLNARAEQQARFSDTWSREQAQTIAKEITALAADLQQVEARIKQSSPRYAALSQPQPLTLREIQTRVLDADTILLHYALGDERSYLWVVTPDSISSHELPAGAEVERLAAQVYVQLSAPGRRPPGAPHAGSGTGVSEGGEAAAPPASPELAKLSQMTLAPTAARLGRKRLLIVADGALQFIPFAALPVPGAGSAYKPLVTEHEVVSLPSTSTLAALRGEVKGRKPAPKALAVLADPVFSASDARLHKRGGGGAPPGRNPGVRAVDGVEELMRAAAEAGLTRDGVGLPRLPATKREAERIMALAPAGAGKIALDFDASRATATGDDLSQYRYVHFATHGLLNSQHPELSGIALSLFDERGRPQDGFLRAHEIFNLKLPVEMVVLSACRTGLGKEIRGEGLVGLTRGFMYAGSPRVVVSLWAVSDEGTAELMVRFYEAILRDGMRPAQALRAAQLSMLKDPALSEPFLWAAFTLQGEWL